MSPRFFAPGVALVAACLVGCAPRATPPTTVAVDLEAEKAAVLKRDQEWHAAVAAKQSAAQIAAFFTEDGVMFGSGQATAVGRDALTEAVQALLSGPDFHDDWKWTRVELSPDGKLAYLVGSTHITINDAAGKPVTTHARLLNVWRKDADGVWRCAVDVWVDEPESKTPG